MADVTTLVRDLAEPLASAEGLDLVDVQHRGSGGATLLRVVVDRKGGVDIARCEQLARALGAALDDLGDAVEGLDQRYRLEVSSPGIDHPLRDRRAFDRVEGRTVLVHRNGGDGRVEQVRGTVTGAEDDAVVLDVQGATVRVPYSQIVKATQSLPW